MLRLGLVVFSILISVNSTSQGGGQKTPEDYWRETGLTFQSIRSYLQEECYKDAPNYLACLQGLNVVAGLLKPASVFATPQEVSHNPSTFGRAIKNYGPFNLYEVQKSEQKLSPEAAWKNQKLFRVAELEATKEVFTTADSNSFRFEKILDDLKPQVLQGDLSDSEASIASDVYNTILKSAVDPHTHIEPLAQWNDELKSTDMKYPGIGIMIQSKAGKVVISNLTRGGPSLEAGLRSRDILASVDGSSTEGLSVYDVSEKLKGPTGKPVTIGVLRKDMPLEITVVRKALQRNNVESRTIEDFGTLYGYIKIKDFSEEKACQEVADGLSEFKDKGVKGLILDLRDNSGGLLAQATCITSLFVGEKVIVQTSDVNGTNFTKYLGQNNPMTVLPLVTLINARSASASEVVAGALQDYKRSWIVGDRSFGKATAQLNSHFNDKIELFQTVQRFYLPLGRSNQVVGIEPDFNVEPVPNATEEDKFALREADQYTNALPPTGKPWTETRPKLVKRIKKCMDFDHLANARYSTTIDDALPPDYRLLNSEVILHCYGQVTAKR